MRTITTHAELLAFLDEHQGFADGVVASIAPASREGSIPDRVSLRVRYQVAGNYDAGTVRTMREVSLVATDVREWTFREAEDHSATHCMEGVDAADAGGLLAIELDVPTVVRLVCGRIDASDPVDRDEWSDPWISDRDWYCEISGARMPTPLEWRAVLRRIDADIHWHMYGGEPNDPERVPPSCSGWYLGRVAATEHPPEPGPAVTIDGHVDSDGVLRVSITRVGPASALWRAATEHVARLGAGSVLCGNCRLSTIEWLTYLANGVLPSRLFAASVPG